VAIIGESPFTFRTGLSEWFNTIDAMNSGNVTDGTTYNEILVAGEGADPDTSAYLQSGITQLKVVDGAIVVTNKTSLYTSFLSAMSQSSKLAITFSVYDGFALILDDPFAGFTIFVSAFSGIYVPLIDFGFEDLQNVYSLSIRNIGPSNVEYMFGAFSYGIEPNQTYDVAIPAGTKLPLGLIRLKIEAGTSVQITYAY
jgi:hypothetical protein